MPLPTAELYIATGCVHCPVFLDALNHQLKQGQLAALHVYNIAVDNTAAEHYGIRSVPWARVGDLILQGSSTPAEINQCVRQASSTSGQQQYIAQLLEQGELHTVEQILTLSPALLKILLPLFDVASTPIQVRIGLSAVIESMANSPALHAVTSELTALASSKHVHVRIDALHFLALSGNEQAHALIEQARHDEHPQVREAAEEILQELAEEN